MSQPFESAMDCPLRESTAFYAHLLMTTHISRYRGTIFESEILMDDERKTNKVTVLLDCADFERLDRYCEKFAFKKSTLIARLVREHLDREGHVPSMQAGPARHVRGGA